MSLYDIDFSLAWNRLLAPMKRLAKFLGWGNVLSSQLQYNRDLFYDNYISGDTSDAYDELTSYQVGEKVRYIDRAIYECIKDATAGILPTDEEYWIKRQDVFIGLKERVRFNAQRLEFEFAMNTWFNTEFRQPTSYTTAPQYYLPKSDIYIENNTVLPGVFLVRDSNNSDYFYSFETTKQKYIYSEVTASSYLDYSFTINIPLAVYNALGPDSLTRENAVRRIADKYVTVGINYNINTY